MGRNAAELVLGTVQLGLDYGIANRTGKPERAAALRLVRRAADAGITQFDTARAYGESEERLGEALDGRPVRTITKLSPLAELSARAGREEVRAAVDASITASLAALRRERIDCLLLHRAVRRRDLAKAARAAARRQRRSLGRLGAVAAGSAGGA